MVNTETLSVTLPAEILDQMREAVAEGEYVSSNEVVFDALCEWSLRRSFELGNVTELRKAWQESADDKTPGVPMDEVFHRLEAKYKVIADGRKVFDARKVSE
jgi:antitoxin ParD1/3/4